MKRVFLYVRVSTEEQAIHGLSIDAQTEALQEWARAEHHQVVGVYTDAGISARKPASKRPALQQLLDDIRAGKGDLVVFTKLDRWFRNISEYYKVQEVLERHHVDWKTIHEDYDTSNANGRLKINIMLSVAQDEADRTSERINAVFEAKRQRLEPITGSCPTGYLVRDKKIIKDPQTEAAVTAYFARYLECGSMSEAREAAKRAGTTLSYNIAYKMLSESCYYGDYSGMQGIAPPYISRKDFEKIQQVRKRQARKTVKNRIYLFSGLITCGECSHRMRAKPCHDEYFSYFCPSDYRQNSHCENHVYFSERKLESYILDTLESELDKFKLSSTKIRESRKTRDYKSEISALKAKVKRSKDLYVNGLSSLEDCKAEVDAYNLQIAELEREAQNLHEPDFSSIEEILCGGWRTLYNASSRDEKRTFWRQIIREIRIYKDRRVEYDFNVDF